MMNLKEYLSFSMLYRKTLTNLIFLLLFCSCIYAQDTLNTNNINELKIEYKETKSPTKALLLSALLPGAGQIYNESYIKAPIVWGVFGFFAYNWYLADDNYNKYNRLYKKALISTSANKEKEIEQNKSYRDTYFKDRDQMAVYLLITYLLNITDAYVDAHMFDFKVENSLYRDISVGLKIKF